MKRIIAYHTPLILILFVSSILSAQEDFRVWPYLQNPATNAMTILWFSEDPIPGEVQYRELSSSDVFTVVSNPVIANALEYSNWEESTFFGGNAPSAPYQHRIRVLDLKPNTNYEYTVTQGFQAFTSSFKTAPELSENIRFIVYADSETEPESAGKYVGWVDPVSGEERSYLVDQDVGYRNNLEVIRSRNPDLVLISGDITESGGEQRDWDEFWFHNAKESSEMSLAGKVPIIPALGNHEYYGGPGLDGYNQPGSEKALDKFQSYFEAPINNSPNADQEGRFYAINYGPATFIVLDVCNNGINGSGDDTNDYLFGESDPGGGNAPDFGIGSYQYEWLENKLMESQENSIFTFVSFHHAPYSSGPHGYPLGSILDLDPQSSYPVRNLTDLFMQYGVDAVFNGHDEMWERSEVQGTEQKPDGEQEAHTIHFFDVGVGGDGLRSTEVYSDNDFKEFLVHSDVPEIWENGVLIDGGKHYGHLEVDIVSINDSTWNAILNPIYVFPVYDYLEGSYSGVERRSYDDQIVLSAVRKNDGSEVNRAFTPGWNWFSVNVENEDMSLENLLSCATEGDYIKNQTESATYYEGIGWFGSLADMGLSPFSSYKIKTINPCEVAYSGTPIDVLTSPFSLTSGWNCIGYLPQCDIPVNEALSTLSLQEGDYIKNQTESATYYEGIAWFGSLATMGPTDGYMLRIQADDQLIYPECTSSGEKKAMAVNTLKHGSLDPARFEFNGVVTASVYLDGKMAGGEEDMVMAYVGEELRGTMGGLYFEPTGAYVYPVMVYGNDAEGESISFKYYNSEKDQVYNCQETLVFHNDMIVANAYESFELNVNSVTGLENQKDTSGPLLNVFPNPFNELLHIEYSVAERTRVHIAIYDMLGKEIEIIEQITLDPGTYSASWNAETYNDGTYFIKMTTSYTSTRQRVILLK